MKTGALLSAPAILSGGLFGLNGLLLIAGLDGNGAGLQGLWNGALQRDVKQAMVEVGTGNFNMIGIWKRRSKLRPAMP